MKRRILAMVVTLMMVINMMPVNLLTSFAETGSGESNNLQIGDYYEVNDETGEIPDKPTLPASSTEQSYENGNVTLNKTIEATNEENVFKITLAATTTETIEEIEYKPDSAVVVVVDCSYSMYACNACQHRHDANDNSYTGDCKTKTCNCTKEKMASEGQRYEAAWEATQAFINRYVQDSDGAYRKIAVVKFSGYNKENVDGAETVVSWTDADELDTTSSTVIHNSISSKLTPDGGTNLQAGLLLADNLLKDENIPVGKNNKPIRNKSVVIISDGAPTYYIDPDSNQATSTSITEICPEGDNMKGEGGSTDHDTHTATEAQAALLKSHGIDVFAAYVGEEGVDCKTNNCINMSGAEWLASECGFITRSANSTEELVQALEIFIGIIESNNQAWQVEDPMGEHNNYDGANRETVTPGEFTEADGTLSWNLKEAEATTRVEGNTTYYTYTLSYNIELDNLDKNFKSGYIPANGVTDLNYVVTQHLDGDQVSYKEDTGFFNIPSVKGLTADYEFAKVDDSGNAVPNAVFTLTTDDDPEWSMSATADANGKVSFKDIPSGHTYKLAETSVPDGYVKSTDEYELVVSYGVASVTGHPDGLTVVNEKIPMVNVEGSKKWVDNGTSTRANVTVSVYGTYVKDGTTYYLYKSNNQWRTQTTKKAYASVQTQSSWSWKNLPGKYDGKDVNWFIEETNIPAGYESYVDGYNITNVLAGDTEYVGQKIWVNDEASDRPSYENMKVCLYKVENGQKTLVSSTPEWVDYEGEIWIYKFTGLEEFDTNGNPIKYIAKETKVPDGYTHTYEVTDPAVGNAAEVVPALNAKQSNNTQSRTFSIGEDKVGIIIGAKTGNNTSYDIWTSRELTQDEKTLVISMAKGKYENISSDRTTFKFGNREEFTRGWGDNLRSATVTTSGNSATITFKDTKSYRVVWNSWYDGYISFEKSYIPGTTVLTNTLKTEAVSVNKVWDDNNNEAGARPDSVKVQLLADGADYGDPVTLDNSNNWEYTWTGLRDHKNGKDVIYTVKEIGTSNSYVSSEPVMNENGEYVITNTFTPDPATGIAIEGTKTMTGRDIQDGDVFKFNIEGADDDTKAAIAGGDITGLESVTITGKGNKGASKAFSFDDITFKKAGTYKFNISEENTGIAGVAYDESTIPVTVTVTYSKAEGKLVATVSYAGGKDSAEFVNEYKAAPAKATLKAAKNLEGRDWAEGDSFEFETTADVGNINVTSENTPVNFEEIEFTKPGTYEYRITEVAPEDGTGIPGMTYSSEVYKAVIEVEDDFEKGSLVIKSIKYYTGENFKDEAETDYALFTNTYDVAAVTGIVFEGDKTLNGRDMKADETFGFSIEGADPETTGAISNGIIEGLVTKTSVSGGKDGETKAFDFGSVTIKEEGTYSFKIKEDVPAFDGNGLKYDRRTVIATVVVTDIGNGYLQASDVKYTVNEKEVNSASFVNKYEVAPVSAEIEASKQLANKELTTGEFTFVLEDSKGNTVTAENDANGSINFNLTYDAAGTYEYTLYEKAGNNGNIVYDAARHTVIVKVTDNGSGQLKAEVKYTNDTKPVFKNTYKVIDVPFEKVWKDNNNQDGKRHDNIEVQLKADGNNVGNPVKLKDGAVTYVWEDLPEFNEDGTKIQYTAVEILPEGTEYASTAKVENGKITITNTYTPKQTSATVTKVWNDNENQDGKRPGSLTVRLLANGEKEISTVVLNSSNGWSATVSGLPKYEAGQEIEYTWSEVSVDGYNASRTTADGNVTTLTNVHDPETVTISIEKEWNDNDDQDGKRNKSVKVQLKANGKAVGDPIELSALNGWSKNWVGLPKYADGSKIIYTVEELDVNEDYSSVVTGSVENGFTVTNTHTPEKTSVSVKKVWSDKNDQDGLRTDSATVQLKADGKDKGTAVTLNDANGWTNMWNDLPKYADGKIIEYTVAETEVPEGYIAEVTGTHESGFTITNTHEPDETSVVVNKVWDDADDQDGIRPESIIVQLKANGENRGAAVTLDDANRWTKTWDNLPKYAYGKIIEYTVVETEVPEGYESEVTGTQDSGFTITNIHEPELTSVSVVKEWNDADNQDGMRTESVTVQLTADEENEGNQVKLDKSNGWAKTWDNLPKYADGTEINYSVVEVEVPEGYGWELIKISDTENSYKIINSYPAKKVSVNVEKIWDDRGDEDKKRPGSVTVQLMADKKAVGAEVILSANNGWAYEWTDLDAFAGGKLIDYTIEEKSVDSYSYKVIETVITNDDDVITGYDFDVTNIYPVPLTSVSVTKAWDDANNQDGIRPDSVTVQLKANGQDEGKEVTLNDSNGWTYKWTDLNVYKNGSKVTYTVEETSEHDGYTPKVTGSAADGYIVTNSHEPAVRDISVEKDWNDTDDQDGIRPGGITVQLKANGKTVGKAVTLNEANGWDYTWKNLDVNADGKEIKYTVSEVKVEGYETEVTGSMEDGFTVTNTHEPAVRDISINKIWDDKDNQDGIRATSIQVQLYADGKAYGTEVTLSESNNWSYTWKGLDANSEGKEINYTVSEIKVAGYETKVTGSMKDGFTITNKHEPDVRNITVNKIWDDENNQDGYRPGSVDVQLYANGAAKGTAVTLNEENGWSYTWEDLDVNADGSSIKYTVREVTVPEGYICSVDGFTITNTHEVEKTEKTVTKVWDDKDNQDGIRPGSVIVQLYADGQPEGDPATVTAKDNWTYTWTDLDKKAAGKDIVYTVDEVNVPEGYSKSVKDMTITNSHTPEIIDIPVTKTWTDKDNQDGIRPGSVTVRLLANGEEVRNAALTEANGWAFSFNDVPKFMNGMKIKYTITEDVVTSYTPEIKDFDITNSYTPAVTSVTVTKAWDDTDNQDGIRPDSVQVQLYADGEAFGEAVTLDESNSWTHIWTGLDEKKAGNTIEYTVDEVAVPEGYEKVITGSHKEGYIVTNTHEVDLTDITVTKQWEDKRDKYNKRPEAITVYLHANGEVIDTVQVTSDANWMYTWTGLDKNANGQEIEYTVSEAPVNGYKTEIDGYNIINKVIPPEQDGSTRTSDDFNMDLYGALALMATLTGAGAVFGRRRRDNE